MKMDCVCCKQVRAQVSEHGGVEVIVGAMKRLGASGGVQCNGCLAIVSLVRAESPVCQVRPLAPRTYITAPLLHPKPSSQQPASRTVTLE